MCSCSTSRLSNLDAALRVSTRVEIAKLHRLLGATMVYVTHDQIEAMTLADRIVVMNHGRIAQAGKPLDLYYTPANLFVAGFIGSPAMNFFDAKVDKKGAASVTLVRARPAAVRSGGAELSRRRSARAVKIGVRPEHLGAETADRLQSRRRGRTGRTARRNLLRACARRPTTSRSSPRCAGATRRRRATRSSSAPTTTTFICSTSRGERIAIG